MIKRVNALPNRSFRVVIYQLCVGVTPCYTRLISSTFDHRPTNIHSPMQLAQGSAPKIIHLHRFSCQVYVPIPPFWQLSLGSLRKSGIYVGFETSSIIRFLDSATGDCHTTRFADCICDDDLFPT